ncbi:MAG: ROK family protein [Candidatus Neomarinimicrobiota bacterium]
MPDLRLGIDYGGTNVKFGVFDENGAEIAFREEKLAELNRDSHLLENLTATAWQFSQKFPIRCGGLAIKGLVNARTGILHNDIGAGQLLAGVNLKQAFRDVLAIPFIVDNDARAYAWGEWRFGAGKGSNPLACLTLGTGFGSALVLNGAPYEGIDPSSGLLGGHISIDRNGPQCPCGSRGCLESYCSAPAFNLRVKAAHPELERYAEALPVFCEAFRLGKTEYSPTLRAFQRDLALGIVNIVHAYGPETVVIGGGVMNSADIILPEVVEMVHAMAWTFPRKNVKIKAAALGNRAAALGVAFHPLLEQTFDGKNAQ